MGMGLRSRFGYAVSILAYSWTSLARGSGPLAVVVEADGVEVAIVSNTLGAQF